MAYRHQPSESVAVVQAPIHPVRHLQGPFEESMLEFVHDDTDMDVFLNPVARRNVLLESPSYMRLVAGRWKQKAGENFHPLWKLVAQISFGVHLLAESMAKSEEDVMQILQTHVDEIDGFLERTTEDFDLARDDIEERLRCLKLPLAHPATFDKMLEDRDFRLSIVEGNEKIEHIVDRTSQFLKDSMKDVQKGYDSTSSLEKYLHGLALNWQRETVEHEAVFVAMLGNVEGWKKAFMNLHVQGNKLGASIRKLTEVINDMQARAGEVSRRLVHQASQARGRNGYMQHQHNMGRPTGRTTPLGRYQTSGPADKTLPQPSTIRPGMRQHHSDNHAQRADSPRLIPRVGRPTTPHEMPTTQTINATALPNVVQVPGNQYARVQSMVPSLIGTRVQSMAASIAELPTAPLELAHQQASEMPAGVVMPALEMPAHVPQDTIRATPMSKQNRMSMGFALSSSQGEKRLSKMSSPTSALLDLLRTSNGTPKTSGSTPRSARSPIASRRGSIPTVTSTEGNSSQQADHRSHHSRKSSTASSGTGNTQKLNVRRPKKGAKHWFESIDSDDSEDKISIVENQQAKPLTINISNTKDMKATNGESNGPGTPTWAKQGFGHAEKKRAELKQSAFNSHPPTLPPGSPPMGQSATIPPLNVGDTSNRRPPQKPSIALDGNNVQTNGSQYSSPAVRSPAVGSPANDRASTGSSALSSPVVASQVARSPIGNNSINAPMRLPGVGSPIVGSPMSRSPILGSSASTVSSGNATFPAPPRGSSSTVPAGLNTRSPATRNQGYVVNDRPAQSPMDRISSADAQNRILPVQPIGGSQSTSSDIAHQQSRLPARAPLSLLPSLGGLDVPPQPPRSASSLGLLTSNNRESVSVIEPTDSNRRPRPESAIPFTTVSVLSMPMGGYGSSRMAIQANVDHGPEVVQSAALTSDNVPQDADSLELIKPKLAPSSKVRTQATSGPLPDFDPMNFNDWGSDSEDDVPAPETKKTADPIKQPEEKLEKQLETQPDKQLGHAVQAEVETPSAADARQVGALQVRQVSTPQVPLPPSPAELNDPDLVQDDSHHDSPAVAEFAPLPPLTYKPPAAPPNARSSITASVNAEVEKKDEPPQESLFLLPAVAYKAPERSSQPSTHTQTLAREPSQSPAESPVREVNMHMSINSALMESNAVTTNERRNSSRSTSPRNGVLRESHGNVQRPRKDTNNPDGADDWKAFFKGQTSPEGSNLSIRSVQRASTDLVSPTLAKAPRGSSGAMMTVGGKDVLWFNSTNAVGEGSGNEGPNGIMGLGISTSPHASGTFMEAEDNRDKHEATKGMVSTTS